MDAAGVSGFRTATVPDEEDAEEEEEVVVVVVVDTKDKAFILANRS